MKTLIHTAFTILVFVLVIWLGSTQVESSDIIKPACDHPFCKAVRDPWKPGTLPAGVFSYRVHHATKPD